MATDPRLTGNSPTLLRQLGILSATALVISNMIGATIFGSTGLIASALGDAKLILAAWVIGALVAFAGALSYAELGLNFPSSGGEYVYLSRAYGPRWGFLTGWISFFAGFSAPIAGAALVFASYAAPMIPGLPEWTLFSAGPLTVGGTQIVAAALIAAFTLLNCFGIGRSAGLQNTLAATTVFLIAGLVVLGFWLGSGSWSHFNQAVERESTRAMPAEFMIQLLWVMVGYSGWNAATYVAEELKHPRHTLPRALVLGTGIVAVLYLGLNTVFIYSTPIKDLQGVVAVGQLCAQNLFGGNAGRTVGALVALSIMSTVNAMITIGPRVYYAMALNGAFPSIGAKVHPKWHTPIASILAQGVCAILMTATPIPGLFLFVGFSLTIFSVLAVGSLLFFRSRSNWQRLRCLDFCFPLIPASYVIVGLLMVGWGILFQPYVPLMVFTMLLAGAAAYRVAG